ncbi:MAG: glycosyltransferase family 4 protein [Candidatus Kryptoniota bacterium]
MKILVINWQDIKNPSSGGAEVHMHQIFSRLAKRNHEVTILCSAFRDAPKDEFVDHIRIVRRGNRNLFNFYVKEMYRQLQREYKFDIVVDDLNKIPFFTPTFIRGPLVTIVHHLFGKTIYKETNPFFASYVYAAESLIPIIYKKVPFVAVSDSTRKELIDKGIPQERIEIISNAVDPTIYNTIALPSPSANRQIIGYVGRIKKYKSVDHLIIAFSKIANQFPQTEVTIVGDGDNIDMLKTLTLKLGLSSRVTFTGKVSEEEKVRLLRQMTFLVNPSAKEGWGLTVIEANACGKTVIAANVPGLKDSVLDNRTGLLYEYGNIESLANKMRELITNQNLRVRLEEEAIRWAANFTWENSADKMETFLEKVIAQHSRRSDS